MTAPGAGSEVEEACEVIASSSSEPRWKKNASSPASYWEMEKRHSPMGSKLGYSILGLQH